MSKKVYYSVDELVRMGLPVCPKTYQGLRLMAEKQGWKTLKIKTRGGGSSRFYLPPPEVMAEIAKKETGKEKVGVALVKTATFDGEVWESAGFVDGGAEVLALELLDGLSGLTVAQVRQVLRCAKVLLDATQLFDSSSTSFRQAVQGYRRAAEKSL